MGAPQQLQMGDQQLPLLQQHRQGDADAVAYTSDGTLDYKGRPAVRSRSGNWTACFLILGTEFCFCLAYYGVSKNLVSYLTGVLHEGNLEAASDVSSWSATGFVLPLLGALLADSCWGRYNTILLSSSFFLAGSIAALASAWHPPAKPALFLGLYLMAIAAGGIRPCISPFGAAQFDEGDAAERVSKGSFFNWYVFTLNTSNVISGTVLVWIQDRYGWTVGFALPAALMCVAVGCFVLGSRVYRYESPGGSPLVRLCQVAVAAARNFSLALPGESSELYELPAETQKVRLRHTDGLSFLDKAAILPIGGAAGELNDPWKLCTVTQVEELKIIVRMAAIIANVAYFYAVSAQALSTFVEQGMSMDNRVGSLGAIPPASLSTFDVGTVIVLIPLYDRLLVPIAGRLTELRRIGIGLFVAVAVMAYAAILETKRLEHAGAVSILWQIPQYSLIGVGEVCTGVGLLELLYSRAPPAMKSVCVAMALSCVSVGSYLNAALLKAVGWATGGEWIPEKDLNQGHLDRFYWLMAAAGVVNLAVFACCTAGLFSS